MLNHPSIPKNGTETPLGQLVSDYCGPESRRVYLGEYKNPEIEAKAAAAAAELIKIATDQY